MSTRVPDSTRIYDKHTLFVKCDGCTVAGITTCIQSALAQLDDSTTHRFHVNVVTDATGASLGIAFVYVAEVAIYYMLLGRNPDGSNRVSVVVEPPTPELGSTGWSSIAPALTVEPGMSWGDICTQDMEVHIVHQPPPPLLTLPPIIVEGEVRRVRVFPAVVYPVNPKYVPHILKANDVPSWMRPEDLRAYFTPFVSDPRTYPTVTINADRTAFVAFDPTTHEAQFTLHMTKKVLVVDSESGESTMLMFNHSFCGHPSQALNWRVREAREARDAPVPRSSRGASRGTPRKPREPKKDSICTQNRFDLLR